jgi:autoinducer 2-degrading protein
MLVNAVTYTFPEGKADEVERLLRELGDVSRRESGCGGFDVCRGDGDSAGTFVLFEKWRDQAALDAHYATEHFKRLGAEGIRPLATSRNAVKGTLVE